MDGEGDSFGTVARAQLVEDSADVKLDGALADEQGVGDVFVGEAAPQALHFASGEHII